MILKRQKQFFSTDTGNLLPLTLSDVANEMNVHEFTASRAIRDKCIQCARGTFPLSFFFTRQLQKQSEEDVSSQQAKSKIQDIINAEDKKKPLSDQKICDLLTQQNISISRRTVAKYRDELGLPSAPGRKIFE